MPDSTVEKRNTALGSYKSESNNERDRRPLLRWAGSKAKLLPTILTCIPDSFNRYIEPFVGSGCVFLRLRPKKAILGDFNKDLVHLYKQIKKEPELVYKMFSKWPSTDQFYYKIRSWDPRELSDIERASRFIYLNRYCFNGVYRTNRMGQFNVPKGKHVGSLPLKEDFLEFSEALKKTRLVAGDFSKTMSSAGIDDFIYLDPPYTAPECRYSGEYGYGAFSYIDINRLIKSLSEADSRGSKILLSYNTSLQEMLPGWEAREIRVRRSIAGFSNKRGTVTEMLYSNFPIPSISLGTINEPTW